jgi:hypothetical protein
MTYYATTVEYDTSEDFSGSIMIFSGGHGTLYLKDEVHQTRLTIPYTYVGVGASKGGDFGLSITEVSMLGTGGSLCTLDGNTIDEHFFPCQGSMVCAGAGLVAGASMAAWMFGGGIPPYGFIKTYGLSLAIGAGGGFGWAHVFYGRATSSKLIPQYDSTPITDVPLDS